MSANKLFAKASKLNNSMTSRVTKKKEVDMNILTQIISKTRFAAKGAFSPEFSSIAKSIPKYFWNVEAKYWTLPIGEFDNFVKKLNDNKFITKEGDFYDSENDFKTNTVVLKIEFSETDLETKLEDLYDTNVNVKVNVNIFLNYFVGVFSVLITTLGLLEGKFEFDNLNNCFTFDGPISILVHYFKNNFFDTNFEYLPQTQKSIPDSQRNG
jgi:hypothetical protein